MRHCLRCAQRNARPWAFLPLRLSGEGVVNVVDGGHFSCVGWACAALIAERHGGASSAAEVGSGCGGGWLLVAGIGGSGGGGSGGGRGGCGEGGSCGSGGCCSGGGGCCHRCVCVTTMRECLLAFLCTQQHSYSCYRWW